MKKIVIIIGSFVVFTQCLYAKEIVGPLSYSDKTVTIPTNIVGPFSGTNVSLQQLTVVGPVALKNSKITGETDIVGTLNVAKTYFDKEVKVTGNLEARDSVFNSFVTVYGAEVSVDLDGTTVKDLIIKEVPGQITQTSRTQTTFTTKTEMSAFDVIGKWFGREVPAEKTTVTVKEKSEEKQLERTVRLKNSTVSGSIIFKGLEGTVVLDDESSIGKIINGTEKGNN